MGAADAKVATIEAEGKAAAMKVLSRAEASRIETVSAALEKACPAAQQNETIRTSGQALNDKSTVALAGHERPLRRVWLSKAARCLRCARQVEGMRTLYDHGVSSESPCL